MRDPVQIGEVWFDRSEIAAVLRQDGRLLVFLKSGKPVSFDDTFTSAEIEKLIADGLDARI